MTYDTTRGTLGAVLLVLENRNESSILCPLCGEGPSEKDNTR